MFDNEEKRNLVNLVKSTPTISDFTFRSELHYMRVQLVLYVVHGKNNFAERNLEFQLDADQKSNFEPST